MKTSELRRIIREEVRNMLREGTYYVTYNKGRGQGKGLVKSEESNYTQPRVFASYEDAKQYVEFSNKMQIGTPGGGTYYLVSDKHMNAI